MATDIVRKKRTVGFWVVGAGGVLLIVCGVIVSPFLLFAVAIWFGSQRTVFERATSPDGWNEARVQFDDAGALSSFNRVVFVKGRWNPSDEALLSCRAFWAEGEEKVHLRWLSKQELLIQHAFDPRSIEASTSHCGNVRITIQRVP